MLRRLQELWVTAMGVDEVDMTSVIRMSSGSRRQEIVPNTVSDS